MSHAYMYGLGGPETGKVRKVLVFKAFLKVSKGPGAAQECKEGAEKYRPGGGRGRVNLPLVGLFEVLEGWRLVRGIYTPRGQRPRRIILGLREGTLWGHFGVTLGHFGFTLRSL